VTSFTSAITSCGLPTALISLLALGACSTELACPEAERTIDHGVYGQVVYRQFQGPDTPFYDVQITVTRLDTSVPVLLRTRSDKAGFYEMTLPDGAGFYMICTSFGPAPCSSLDLATVVRADLVVEQETAVYWETDVFRDCP
jgi:hypothetical protein